MLRGWRIRLVDGWKEAHRWSSIRFLALGGAAQLALVTTPQRVLDYAPAWALQGLSILSIGCIFLAGAGRLTQVEKVPCPSPTSSPASPGSSSAPQP